MAAPVFLSSVICKVNLLLFVLPCSFMLPSRSSPRNPLDASRRSLSGDCGKGHLPMLRIGGDIKPCQLPKYLLPLIRMFDWSPSSGSNGSLWLITRGIFSPLKKMSPYMRVPTSTRTGWAYSWARLQPVLHTLAGTPCLAEHWSVSPYTTKGQPTSAAVHCFSWEPTKIRFN